MEHVVDPSLLGQFQLEGHKGYDLCDFKGSGLFGRKFPKWYLGFEVPGFESDFVSNFLWFEAKEGLFCYSLFGEFVGNFGFLPYILS